MSNYQLLRCLVAIGGDQGNQVYRDRSRPIVFPELPLLQFIHGEDAVTEIHVVGQWDTTNDEVLARIQQIYSPETVREVFPGTRPRLPMADASIPRCTMPVYKPRPVRPDSPDPKLRPLDQFTQDADQTLDAPDLEPEDEPSPEELAAHLSDDDDDPTLPRPENLPHVAVHDTQGRGSGGRRASANRTSNTLPDVAAATSHPPEFEGYTSRGVDKA